MGTSTDPSRPHPNQIPIHSPLTGFSLPYIAIGFGCPDEARGGPSQLALIARTQVCHFLAVAAQLARSEESNAVLRISRLQARSSRRTGE